MLSLKYNRSTRKRHLRGISLIESLVAMVVTALGILGILGVQMRTLSDTSTTARRAQAIRLIEDLSERTKVSPNAVANLSAYVTGFSDTPSVGSCASGCNPAQLAAYDLAVWKKTLRATLPLGQASIFIPPAESSLPAGLVRQLGVMIAWRENENVSKVSDADDADATSYRGAINAGTGGGTDKTTNACPDNFTCHLQYIPIAGRCAPYVPGGSPATHHCPGA